MFNPEESIDFNGNTAPFIQYTYARIQSVIRKGMEMNKNYLTSKINDNIDINEKKKNC
jgi:arginyl-tRNA synthetase